jgi:hypothetical protein
VLPMCPVRSVTYVSGRSFNEMGRRGRPKNQLPGFAPGSLPMNCSPVCQF